MAHNLTENFVNPPIFRTFAIARVPNNLNQCGLKTHHYKSMPGSTVGLGTLAGSYTRLRRAVLCLLSPVYQILRDMNTQKQLCHILADAKTTSQQVRQQNQHYLQQIELFEAHLDYLNGKIDINPRRVPVIGAKGLVMAFPVYKTKEVRYGG